MMLYINLVCAKIANSKTEIILILYFQLNLLLLLRYSASKLKMKYFQKILFFRKSLCSFLKNSINLESIKLPIGSYSSRENKNKASLLLSHPQNKNIKAFEIQN